MHKSEDGWALVIAMVVMVLMLGIGLAALSLSDTQNQQSRKEREREGSINLAEGVLYSQSFILALPSSANTGAVEGWPGSASHAYAAGCTQATPGIQCPDDKTLANVANTVSAPASFQSVDVGATSAWSSTIQDNGAVGAISNDYANKQSVGWDANGDGRIWVRATAIVRNHKRTVVGLMQIEQIPVSFPRVALSAGSFSIGPSGNNTYINTGGTGIQVRCTGATPSATCADYSKNVNTSPSAPGSITTGLAKASVLTATQKAQLKSTAMANGSYYATGCPTGAQLTGEVVYVENCTKSYGPSDLKTNCTFSGTAYVNCANGGLTDPNGTAIKAGTLVWNKGTLDFGGNVTYIGVIYHLNADNCGTESPTPIADGPTCPALSGGQSFIVSTGGGATIVGALNVDGGGGVKLGSNGLNLVYDPNVFNNVVVYGTTGLVQNTWRELDPNQ